MGVLSGYRVIDLTIAMAGPLAAMRLGDLGADVIKVEPTGGEWQRHTAAGGAAGKQVNASFLSLNRNKRSLAVDLKSAEGREIVLDLARGSDVFLQNYRPGVAERLGMDYESIRAARPDIVYVSISGYGESGPYVNRPGQDMLLQAMSGAMLNVGRAGDPPAPGGHLRGGRDHRVRRVRGGAGRAAAPGADRRGPAGHGQHAGLGHRGAGPGAVHLHRRRGAAAPRPRAARAHLHPGAVRHVRHRGRVPGAGLPAPGRPR